jgi:hypothetical protein
MAKYTIDPADPTKLGSFVKDGELIDNNGKLGNYDDVVASGGG